MRKNLSEKQVFLNELSYHLRKIRPEERQEILRDQEEYIHEAMQSGRSEEEVVSSLGDPKAFARNLILELKLSEVERTEKSSTQLRLIFGVLFAMLALAPLNLILFLGPFIVVISLLATGWISAVGTLALAVGSLAFFIGKMVFASVGIMTHLSAIFFILGSIGLGLLCLLAMGLLSQWFFKGTAAYLRWNINFIKGRV